MVSSDDEDEKAENLFSEEPSKYIETEKLYEDLVKLKAVVRTEKKDIKKQKFIISVVDHARFKTTWEVIIIIMALYSVVVIPVKLGVNKNILGQAYDYIDAVTYVFYFLDLIFAFRTTFLNA